MRPKRLKYLRYIRGAAEHGFGLPNPQCQASADRIHHGVTAVPAFPHCTVTIVKQVERLAGILMLEFDEILELTEVSPQSW